VGHQYALGVVETGVCSRFAKFKKLGVGKVDRPDNKHGEKIFFVKKNYLGVVQRF
jgi:hypothetical protein